MFVETNQIKLVFSMIWLMEILAADKVLCNKTFNVAKNPKYDGYERELASVVLLNLVVVLKIRFFSNKQLSEELHKPIFRQLHKRNVHFPFIAITGVQIQQICN